jgi:hypothetical protein
MCLFLAVAALGPSQTRPAPKPAAPNAAANACEQEWLAMAQRNRQQADAMVKQVSGQRSLLAMLRNDAGIVRDSNLRDALQVNADMWESQLTGLQQQAASLQQLAQQAETKAHALCGSK